jgi:hypothetical protein
MGFLQACRVLSVVLDELHTEVGYSLQVAAGGQGKVLHFYDSPPAAEKGEELPSLNE